MTTTPFLGTSREDAVGLIADPTGAVHSCPDLTTLKAWIAQGYLNEDYVVFDLRRGWTPLWRFTELRPYFRHAAPVPTVATPAPKALPAGLVDAETDTDAEVETDEHRAMFTKVKWEMRLKSVLATVMVGLTLFAVIAAIDLVGWL